MILATAAGPEGVRRVARQRRHRRLRPGACLPALPCLLAVAVAAAQTSVLDDSGSQLVVHAPVQRIVSLSADATELVIAAGAGERLAAAVVAAGLAPASAIVLPAPAELDQIIAVHPDLVVSAADPALANVVAQLRARGLAVYQSSPLSLDDIARTIEKLGWLARTEDVAKLTAVAMREQWEKLRESAAGQRRLRVYVDYAVAPGEFSRRFITDTLARCGATQLLPASDGVREAQLAPLAPQVVIGVGVSNDGTWPRRWPTLAAGRSTGFYRVDASLFSRSTPRILSAAQQLCDILRQARGRAPAPPTRDSDHGSTAFPHAPADG